LEDPSVFAAFSASLPANESLALANLHLSAWLSDKADVADLWKGLAQASVSAEIAALQSRMRHPDTPLEEVGSLHKQILDLQKRLGHF
jgi:hypothetical protein